MLKCKYAWSHLDFLQGQYAPCYRFKVKPQPIADAEQLPSDVINNDAMQSVRASLQQGVFPPGCEDCAHKEQHGMQSYRQRSLLDTEWKDDSIDYTTTQGQILDLEIKFSRTCNYYCRHCMADSNSHFEQLGARNPQIDQQLQQLSFDHLGIADSPITTPTPEVLEDIIQNHLDTIQRIRFSGGEPLYHLQHYKFLERIQHAQHLKLEYNTNLSMLNFKGYDLKKLWQPFANIGLTVSMDGVGAMFNYFRQQADYDTTVQNLLNIADHVDSIQLVCTTTAYHAFDLANTFDTLTRLAGQLRQQGVQASVNATFVHYPQGLDVCNLPDTVTQELVELAMAHNNTDSEYIRCRDSVIRAMQRPNTCDTDRFAQIVRLQDQLHSNTCEQFPLLYNFVYGTHK
jgi:organic radical activating enzyme